VSAGVPEGKKDVKIALVQTNPIIGDFSGNLEEIFERLAQARDRGCRLAVFPELALCGYPPRDLLERPAFLRAHARALERLVDRVRGIACVIGAIQEGGEAGSGLFNSALLIDQGRVRAAVHKQLLPSYDVFDESRYFEPGPPSVPVVLDKTRLALSVCEDIWPDPGRYPIDPVARLAAVRPVPDLLINISASPYHHGKLAERERRFSALCRRHGLPLLYVNQVGGQDELIFDGHSLVMDGQGNLLAAGRGFARDMLVVDTGSWQAERPLERPRDSVGQVLDALTLGVRDYLAKTGFTRAVLGSSGGIDSALTAAIACRALGPDNVLTVALPSPYTSQASLEDAQLLADNLGCGFEILPITPAMEAMNALLAPFFSGMAEDVTEQNLQARIRGTLLMALSNKLGHLLLSTGNKSEMAVGYCTLYGDMNGGLAVLADVPKTLVYRLAREINQKAPVIPGRILSRPPTAELRPDQTDQDDLPPYDLLDRILTGYLEERLGVDELVARGFARPVVEDVVHRIRRNEYKRRQAATGLRVTAKAFGAGRRYPVAQGFVEETMSKPQAG